MNDRLLSDTDFVVFFNRNSLISCVERSNYIWKCQQLQDSWENIITNGWRCTGGCRWGVKNAVMASLCVSVCGVSRRAFTSIANNPREVRATGLFLSSILFLPLIFSMVQLPHLRLYCILLPRLFARASGYMQAGGLSAFLELIMYEHPLDFFLLTTCTNILCHVFNYIFLP